MFPVSGAAQLVAYSPVNPIHLVIVHLSSQTYLTSHPTLSQVLGHKPILQVAEPSTLLEVCLGQEHVPQSQLLGLDLEVLDDLWVRREALLGGLADLAEVDGVGGNAFFFDELLDLLVWRVSWIGPKWESRGVEWRDVRCPASSPHARSTTVGP